MDWKEFFKPTKGKIILFVILFVVIILISVKLNFVIYKPGERGVGLPLILSYNKISELGEGYWDFSFLNFTIDIIFWYLTSCLFVFLFRKIKNRT